MNAVPILINFKTVFFEIRVIPITFWEKKEKIETIKKEGHLLRLTTQGLEFALEHARGFPKPVSTFSNIGARVFRLETWNPTRGPKNLGPPFHTPSSPMLLAIFIFFFLNEKVH